MPNPIHFFLNGRPVTLENPSPDLLLVDYLRSPSVGLCGPKKPCAQGGCGGCTVILSNWNGEKVEHRAINSCLRPVLAVNGMVVTTVEGTGAARRPNPSHPATSRSLERSAIPSTVPIPESALKAQEAVTAKREAVRNEALAAQAALHGDIKAKLLENTAELPLEQSNEGMNPVAWRLAINNGTQCGYCTVGFVMNMSEFLVNTPGATKLQIEDALDGNLCRCTGYRSILTGMKTFASDWSTLDEEERMKCLADPDAESQKPTGTVNIPFPVAARVPVPAASIQTPNHTWLAPNTLQDLLQQMRAHPDARLISGNTSFGIYKQEYLSTTCFLDIRQIPELNQSPDWSGGSLRVPANLNYTDLIRMLEQTAAAAGQTEKAQDGSLIPSSGTRWGALYYMARRTAGRIVRNAASLAGNSMLVLHHIHGQEAPFPSDLATALVAAKAEVEYADVQSGQIHRHRFEILVQKSLANREAPKHWVLLNYYLPEGNSNEVVLSQKVALREVNAHTIVNATTRVALDNTLRIQAVGLVFGGLAPYPWRALKTEAAMRGQVLTLQAVKQWINILKEEVQAALEKWGPRTAHLPSEGFTDAYRLQLALGFYYKAMINTLSQRGEVPVTLRSAGAITWGRWAVSNGIQKWAPLEFRKPVAQPYIKYLAMEQASGQVHYVHELAVPPRTVDASLVQSTRALASWYFSVPGQEGEAHRAALCAHLREKFPHFVDLITAENLQPTMRNLQGMGSDQPVLTPTSLDVQYVGQCLGIVCAKGEQQAARIAEYVTANCVSYGAATVPEGAPSWWSKPVLGLDQAIKLDSIYPDNPTQASFNTHIWKIRRPGTRLDWTRSKKPLDQSFEKREIAVDGVPCVVTEGIQYAGAQVHFYMEPQATIVEPMDGKRFKIRPSSQSPGGIHSTVASVLGVQYNSIEVFVPPLGGGFGGKTEPSKFVAAAAALAAYTLKMPVRLTLTREQDTAMIGKRHAYYGQYQVAIDKGSLRPEDKGLLRGFYNKMWGDGGAFYDCSFVVSNCIQTRADNAYRVANFENQLDVCRTNTSPSTAFRAFGDIQGKILTESAIDDAAFCVGMTAEEVREKNLYEQGDVTPFGQALSVCYMRQVWKMLKDNIHLEQKRAEVIAYNQANRWRKRGLAMLPVKYGSGYNLKNLEQASAVVSIYPGDGTVIVQQGGVEMGQGLLTMVRQITALVLNIPLDMVFVQAANTAVIPNPTGTGASTGTSYNGEAVKRVCQDLVARLTAFGHALRMEKGEEWCKARGLDYWNYGLEGWQAKVKTSGGEKMIWQNLVSQANGQRVGLIASFTVAIPGGETQSPALIYKPYHLQPTIPGYQASSTGVPGEFDNFCDFTYSAACSVVEVDILTGETKILSSDVLYDMGESLNPAIDIGQVEGAFVQGIGYLTSEKLVYEPDGDQIGTLNTLNTWTYKPPAVPSIPLSFNVRLFPRQTIKEAAPNGIFSSKEVGEPPLVLAASVWLAIKDAIRASRVERGLPGLFRFDAPATVQEVRRACAVDENESSFYSG